VLGATALQAATTAATRAAVERAGLRWFYFTTGIWAGDKKPAMTNGAADTSSGE
jgi:hypothetical protein